MKSELRQFFYDSIGVLFITSVVENCTAAVQTTVMMKVFNPRVCRIAEESKKYSSFKVSASAVEIYSDLIVFVFFI